jgi:hypothetical protein
MRAEFLGERVAPFNLRRPSQVFDLKGSLKYHQVSEKKVLFVKEERLDDVRGVLNFNF